MLVEWGSDCFGFLEDKRLFVGWSSFGVGEKRNEFRDP